MTSKPEPGDVDAVMLLPLDFDQQINSGKEDALELDAILVNRWPEEMFGAEDEEDWDEWVEFFSRTRENDGRRKGLVEIILS